ncbi:hypothetical protein EMCRGX_G030758 [Ephydatia muelleri]
MPRSSCSCVTTCRCHTPCIAIKINVSTCSPLILNTNSSSMSLQWNAPLQPDYVITAYTLHHRVPSLKSQSEMWAPPSTATVQFHTYNPSGILFYQINSVMTDFLGHVFYPLLNASDGFDAVSVQNVGSTYIIVSWDLPTHSNDIHQLQFVLQWCSGGCPAPYCDQLKHHRPPPLHFVHVHVLQSRLQALHSSWNMVLGVISAAASLPRPYTVIPWHSSPGPHVHPSPTTLLSASGAYCQSFMTPTSHYRYRCVV